MEAPQRPGPVLTDFADFFAVEPWPLGVPWYQGCRWNGRKSERPDVTTGSPPTRCTRAETRCLWRKSRFALTFAPSAPGEACQSVAKEVCQDLHPTMRGGGPV
eukprot:gene13032-biopygen14068